MLWFFVAIVISVLLYYLVAPIVKNNEYIINKLNNINNYIKENLNLDEIKKKFTFINLKFDINKNAILFCCFMSIFIILSIALFGIATNSKGIDKMVQAETANIKIKGINISNNDKDVDLNSVVKAGGEYAYLKATEGSTFKDPDMDTYYKQCKNLGMKVGVYHYLVNTSMPEEQARNFYYMICQYDWDLIPMLDAEVYFDGLEDYIKRFKDEFNRLSSLKLGLYSYTSFINEHLSNANSEIYNMPLWEANYNGKPWIGVGKNNFVNLVGHQYSTDKHIKEYIGNFNGDINEFNEKALISNE